MINRIAIIENGKVINVIMADDKFIENLSGEYVVLPSRSTVGTGFSYVGGVFTAPNKTAQWVAQTAHRDWLTELTSLEKDLPDWLEYHIAYAHGGVCGDPAQQVIYNRKKALRASEPA